MIHAEPDDNRDRISAALYLPNRNRTIPQAIARGNINAVFQTPSLPGSQQNQQLLSGKFFCHIRLRSASGQFRGISPQKPKIGHGCVRMCNGLPMHNSDTLPYPIR